MTPQALFGSAGFVGANLAAGATFAAIACLFGRSLTRAVPWGDPVARFAGATAVGLAALGQALFLLGLAGWLRPLPVALLLVAALATSVRAWPAWRKARWSAPTAGRLLMAGIAGAAILPLFLLPWYPPVDFDATFYHLPYARAFADTGGLPALPDLRFPVFPQLNEVLFAAALLLWNDLGAQWLQALAGLLTAALLLRFDPREEGGIGGWVAAAMWLGTPMVVKLSGAAYVDLGTTLFFTLCAFALLRWHRAFERPWLTLAAFAAGCAAASKYTGLFAVGAVVAVALWDGRRRKLADAAWALLVAALTAGPWYLRIYVLTGNPVYPCFSELFGGEPMDMFGSAGAMLHANGGWGEALRSWLALPWTLVRAPAEVGWTWSRAYLVALPLAVWAAAREPWGRRLGLAILAFSLVFALLAFPDARLLLPIAPLWCHLVGRGFERLSGVWPPTPRAVRVAATLAVALALWPGARKGWRDVGGRGLPPRDEAGRHAYLRARLPAYAAVEHVNRTVGAKASIYAFFAENLNYYAAGRYQGDWFGPSAYGKVFPKLGDPDALADHLRGLGASHVLLAPAPHYPRPALPEDDPAVRRRFEPVFDDPGARVYRLR